MSSKDMGGPAFPQDLQGRRTDDPHLEGMTLWDYYAAAALQRLERKNEPPKWIAYQAAEYADAMLAERAKRMEE